MVGIAAVNGPPFAAIRPKDRITDRLRVGERFGQPEPRRHGRPVGSDRQIE
jgi:hypothetical protein